MKGLSFPQGASSSLVLDTQGQPEISRSYSLARPSLTQQAVCMQIQRHKHIRVVFKHVSVHCLLC